MTDLWPPIFFGKAPPQFNEGHEELGVEMGRVAWFSELFGDFAFWVKSRAQYVVQKNEIAAEVFVPSPLICAVVPGVEMGRRDEISRPSRAIDVAVTVAIHERLKNPKPEHNF